MGYIDIFKLWPINLKCGMIWLVSVSYFVTEKALSHTLLRLIFIHSTKLFELLVLGSGLGTQGCSSEQDQQELELPWLPGARAPALLRRHATKGDRLKTQGNLGQ